MMRCLAVAGLCAASLLHPLNAARAEAPIEVVPVSSVKWDKLNPARGDASPRAATLWGDRSGSEATGFLVKFVDGFRSPPHIHNVSYRGVVISGLIHNDDPTAADMWMPPGSYWTQPKAEVHVTAASGRENLAYIEIEEGPYLVQPIEEAFDSGERPINVDVSNIVWLPLRDGTQNPSAAEQPMVAYLWGSPGGAEPAGTMLRLTPGFSAEIESGGTSFRAVVISGRLDYQLASKEIQPLLPGSYFGSEGASNHAISCALGAQCVIYVRAEGDYRFR